MAKLIHTHLERRPTGYYFRRRIPAAACPAADADSGAKSGTQKKSSAPHQTAAVCLSLRTQFLPDAKRLARRLTAASEALFAAQTEQDMPISAQTMVAILKLVRDQQISAHESTRARGPERSAEAVNAALSREAAIQDALRDALALGKRDTAAPLLKAAADRLGLALDQHDPDFLALAHQATRLLLEISAERARRETGDYGSDSVLAALSQPGAPATAARFQTCQSAAQASLLAAAFGQDAPLLHPEVPLLRADATAAPVAQPTPVAMPAPVVPATQVAAIAPALAPASVAVAVAASVAAPTTPTQPTQAPPEPPHAPAQTHALPELRIDASVLSAASRAALRDPCNMRIEQAFDAYFEIKLAGYGDDFHKSQKRRPKGGENWQRNSRAGLVVARRIWSDLLGNCKLSEVSDHQISRALLLLARLPKDHGKAYKAESVQAVIDLVDLAEIDKEAKANRTIESTPDLSEANADKLLQDAKIPRLRAETYLKHGRAMGRIGRCLEGLGLLSSNPFSLCSWNKDEEEDLRNQEATRARQAWDDRIYKLFRTPVFQGDCDGPGDPLFWTPLIALHDGPRMQEILQLTPQDFGVEGGMPYFRVRNTTGNSVKSGAGERELPVHPNLIDLGLMDLVELRRREGAARLFPDLARGETKGNHAELFSKSFGYYRKTHDVYWPGLDFHALRTTFHSFLLNSDRVSDARRRRLMGHSPLDEGEKSYAQGLRMSTLLEDVKEVQIDIAMIQSPFANRAKVVSLTGIRQRIAAQ